MSVMFNKPLYWPEAEYLPACWKISIFQSASIFTCFRLCLIASGALDKHTYTHIHTKTHTPWTKCDTRLWQIGAKWKPIFTFKLLSNQWRGESSLAVRRAEKKEKKTDRKCPSLLLPLTLFESHELFFSAIELLSGKMKACMCTTNVSVGLSLTIKT